MESVVSTGGSSGQLSFSIHENQMKKYKKNSVATTWTRIFPITVTDLLLGAPFVFVLKVYPRLEELPLLQAVTAKNNQPNNTINIYMQNLVFCY